MKAKKGKRKKQPGLRIYTQECWLQREIEMLRFYRISLPHRTTTICAPTKATLEKVRLEMQRRSGDIG